MNAQTLSLLVLLSASGSAMATPLSEIQHQWAHCQYELTGKAQQACLERVVEVNDAALKADPFSDELKVWLAINTSTLAGAKGGFGALSLAKRAKALLEEVIRHDDSVLAGSAYTSLGSLYYQVPGWPLGFGDDDKAQALLLKALEINPDGIDPNFFYADYLMEQKRYREAQTYLRRAQQAPARPDRPLADAGRQKEVAEALQSVDSKLKV